ncbi:MULTISPECIES: MotA/TolQ/ExbB proton channel family protein [Undibacterium]|jgi:biopolymer transport protein ExbB|uniref:Biopolymer transport protein ExbB n=2 Tax=Undibacterium TaxID=401469 RepID=A0A941DD78_9BURK|nr:MULTISPECIES: MotA/TolQ/ExbB proton channel family protein [Undibacterium]MBR7746544.1 MotA/TolQ/ExbB proton channel family protein [Undibacterium baiyunense]GGX05098.1 biopolymer transporter ExbB [Undibacterium macrobrachii]
MKTRAKVSTFLAAILFALTATMTTAPAFAQETTASAASATEATAASAEAAPAAAEAPAADASVPAAEPKPEVVDQYSLSHLIKEGTLVDQATLAIMLIMSMFTWYILITKIIDLAKLNTQAKEARKFWKAANVAAGLSTLKEGSPYRFIAESGISASEHHEGALLEQIDLNSWVTMSIQRSVEKVQSRLGEGLTFLATVGSTAPFIGLFGTVMGIYHALVAIGSTGNSSIDKVAGPVGSALIMTAIGLGVAVPAVLGYNYLLRRNKAAMEDINAFGADLHSVVLSGAMSKANSNK